MSNVTIRTRVLGVDAYVVSENTFEIRLTNGSVITVETNVETCKGKYEYSIDDR